MTPQTGELIQSPTRIPNCSLDDQYIHFYLENPTNKTEALRRAAESLNVQTPVHRQKAYDIHHRLKRRINKLLEERMLDGAALGYTVMIDLAQHSDSDSVRAACAAKLVEYSGRNKPAQATEQPGREDIKSAIEQTKARIYAITGKQIT